MAAIQARFGLGGGRQANVDPLAATSFDTVLARSGGGDPALGTDPTGGSTLAGEAPAGGWPLLTGSTLPAGLLAAAGVPAGADDSGTGASGTDVTAGAAVVAAAEEYLGVPYLWGGTNPGKGLDCSGLVQLAFRQVGVEMPKWSRNQATMGVPVDSIDEALPGDVLTFGHPVTHVALYVGDGKMLHAPKRGEVVKIEPIDRAIGSIRRIVTPDGGPWGPGIGSPGTARSRPPTHRPPEPDVAWPPPPAVPPARRAAPTDLLPRPTTSTSWTAGPAEQRFQQLFADAGRRWNVDPALLAAVAQTESGFNPEARSPAGAQGLMQFMPATAAAHRRRPVGSGFGHRRRRPLPAHLPRPLRLDRGGHRLLQRRPGSRGPLRRCAPLPRDPQLRPQGPRRLESPVMSSDTLTTSPPSGTGGAADPAAFIPGRATDGSGRRGAGQPLDRAGADRSRRFHDMLDRAAAHGGPDDRTTATRRRPGPADRDRPTASDNGERSTGRRATRPTAPDRTRRPATTRPPAPTDPATNPLPGGHASTTPASIDPVDPVTPGADGVSTPTGTDVTDGPIGGTPDPAGSGPAVGATAALAAALTTSPSAAGSPDTASTPASGAAAGSGVTPASLDTASIDTASLNTASLNTAPLDTASLNTASSGNSGVTPASLDTASLDCWLPRCWLPRCCVAPPGGHDHRSGGGRQRAGSGRGRQRSR